MDYQTVYDDLILKFRDAKTEGYTESHHIIPRCLGGGNEPSNLVDLPARYHFVAHLLLAKIHGGKLIYAAWRMHTTRKYSSRRYEWLQMIHAEQKARDMRGNQRGKKLKGRKQSPEHRLARKLDGNKINLGRKHSQETRDKVSQAQKGRKRNPETARKGWATRRKNGTDKLKPESIERIKANHASMAGSNNPMYGKRHSADTKAKIGAKTTMQMKGNQHTKGMRFKVIDGKRTRVE
jgi:NUMOD3 motif